MQHLLTFADDSYFVAKSARTPSSSIFRVSVIVESDFGRRKQEVRTLILHLAGDWNRRWCFCCRGFSFDAAIAKAAICSNSLDIVHTEY